MKHAVKSVALFSILVLAAQAAFAGDVRELIGQQQDHLLAFYRDLHENPELSKEEKRTSEKVAAEFRALGFEVIEHIGGYGVAGILKNGSGPVTWMRSELDALPVPEETGLPYKSKNPGKMHACGHDFHATSLVGTAAVMAKMKSAWKGTLVFVAQPAEEGADGAQAMINDGVFKKLPKPDHLMALHTLGQFKKGTLGITSGYALANVDSIDVVFKGRGAHGSTPEKGIDPFIMAAEFTLKLQTLIGREKEASKPAVLSVGSIHGGTKHNIIPEDVKLQLTMRTYDPDLRAKLKKRVVEVAQGIAKTSGAPDPKVDFVESTEATYNDPVFAERIFGVFTKAFGKDVAVKTEPIMGGEDFGLFGKVSKVPSLMFFVGERDEKQPSVSNHSPKYAPDLKETLPLAIRATIAALADLHQ